MPECNSFTGKCQCKQNVVGHDCDKCKDGYWNLDSGNGCEACDCDPIGSLNSTCDVATGQCYCREGITGLHCNQLVPLHYGFSMDGAQECLCDPSGSLNEQCDVETGQCECRPQVEGRQCDRCMENTRSVPASNEKICKPCDDCYDLVQDSANQHRQDLQQLDQLLTHIAENPEPIGQEFEVQLKKLKVRIRNMVDDSKLSSSDGGGGSLRDRLEELGERLTKVEEAVSGANLQLDSAQLQGDQADQNVVSAEEVINRARETLKKAKNQMDVDGREALRKAEEIARQFGKGNEQMSELAGKARRLAEEQHESASEIESIAKQANKISNEAYSKARSALEEQVDTANTIQVLQARLREMGTKLGEVQSESQQTLAAASEAYLQALTIYQSVWNLAVPEVNTDQLEDQASRVSKDAERIREDAERLIGEHEELLAQAGAQRQQMRDLMKQAELEQQLINDRLQMMEQHRDGAQAAVNSGNTVLGEAKKTLEILEDFENRVNDNREAANTALDSVYQIEETLRQANEQISTADENLHKTDEDSVTAHEIAVDTKNTAEEASKHAGQIVEESAKIKEQATKLKTDAESLQSKSAETAAVVAEKEDSSSRDAQLAAEALREANKAQSSSKEATEKVQQAKRELEEISQILSSISAQGKLRQRFEVNFIVVLQTVRFWMTWSGDLTLQRRSIKKPT